MMHTQKLRLMDRLVLTAMWVFPALFITVAVAAAYPEYWTYIIPELSPMAWLESLLLFFISVLAFLCAGLSFLRNETRKALWWTAFACGFLALAVDERFAVHERIRELLLAPHNVKLVFFWVSPGDITLLVVMIAGLAALPFVIRLFADRKPALILFIAAVVLSAAAVISDSFDYQKMSLEALRMEQFVEELVETSAMILYANAVYLMVSGMLGKLCDETGL